jgi:hypothetical protein
MNQPKQNGPSQLNKNSSSLSEGVIQQFLENQKAQLYNDAEELKLRAEELKQNARLAEKSMEFQAAHLSRQPSEGRKTVTRIAYIFGGIMLLLFIFVGFCLYLNKDQFIIAFLKNAGYVVTTGMGYWFGRRVGKENERKKNADVIDEVEIVKN